MSIADYRKFAISLILAPYFVNIQHHSNTEAFCKTKEWLLPQCATKSKTWNHLYHTSINIMKAIERARNSGIKSLKFQETLKVKNKALYEMLR